MLNAVKALWERTFLREVLKRERWLGVVFGALLLGQCIAQVLRVTPAWLS